MKFKIIKRAIKEEEADQVIDLANWGMARKMIAKEVYGSDKEGNPTHSSLMRVHHILARWEVRVTDYRVGKNKPGRAVIAATRRGANILESIRMAGKKMEASITRKTG